MQNIQSFSENQKIFLNTQAKASLASNYQNVPSLQLKPKVDCDVFKPSSKKQINKNKLVLGIGVFAVAVGGCVALLKCRNMEKAKKELTALYDELSQVTSDESIKLGFDFVKPKLVFKKLDKATFGQYSPATNEIMVDLGKKNFFVTSDYEKVYENKISDDLVQIYDRITAPGFKAKEAFRLVTNEEALAIRGCNLFHELTHAKQIQLALNTKGGKEALIQGYKKLYPRYSDEKMKKLFSFVFNFEPKKLLDETEFKEWVHGFDRTYSYSIKDLVDGFCNYDFKDEVKYYTNLIEIDARNRETKYWHGLLKGYIKKPKDLSDDFIQYQRRFSLVNVLNCLDCSEKISV